MTLVWRMWSEESVDFYDFLMLEFYPFVSSAEGFPLWFVTWPRPHLELSLATTTAERHSSMPLVSTRTHAQLGVVKVSQAADFHHTMCVPQN